MQPPELVPCTLRELLRLLPPPRHASASAGRSRWSATCSATSSRTRRWISKQDYDEGLALAQLAPGPLAAQLAIYLGWVRARRRSARRSSRVAFVLPSFLMVLALSALYLRYGGLPWMQGAFYGIGAAVIAIIARSAYEAHADRRSARTGCCGRIFAVSAARHGVDRVGDRLAVRAARRRSRAGRARSPAARRPRRRSLPWPLAGSTGLHGPASGRTLWRIVLVLRRGGRLRVRQRARDRAVPARRRRERLPLADRAPVPRRRRGRDDHARARWSSRSRSSATWSRARSAPRSAAIGVFLPCYLFVVIPATYFRRSVDDPRVKAFVDGVTAAADGRDRRRGVRARAARDRRRADRRDRARDVARAGHGCRRAPEPLVIVAAGIVGLAIRGVAP